jgi:hypothetical protein
MLHHKLGLDTPPPYPHDSRDPVLELRDTTVSPKVCDAVQLEPHIPCPADPVRMPRIPTVMLDAT